MDKRLKLFAPMDANGLRLKNRIVMAPCTRSRAIGNLPNELITEYYRQRASAGFIISECISPSPNGLTYPRIPGIFNEEQTNAWKKVTHAVHAEGGLIFAQLNHPGRIGSFINLPKGEKIVGASNISAEAYVWTDIQGMVKSDVPQELNSNGIKQIIRDFANAAKNAIDAGFDGVEIHGANGYLIEQFLNPHINIRTDEYGGSIENRCRFAIEVTRAVAEAIGADKLGIRLSPYSELCALPPYADVDETYEYLAEQMNKLFLLYIHLVDPTSRQVNSEPKTIANVRALSLEIRDIFEGLLILNGAYNKQRAVFAIEHQEADLISFGTAFIANPDLPYRLENDLNLTKTDSSTFYTSGEAGLTDYPFYSGEVLVQ